MSLKNLPLDAGKLGATLCVGIERKTDNTGAVKTDPEGVPLWVVSVAVRPEGRRGALIEVSVSGEPEGLVVGEYVQLHSPEAFWWEIAGKAGLSFRADRVTPAPAPVVGPARAAATASAAAGEGAESPRAGRAGAK